MHGTLNMEKDTIFEFKFLHSVTKLSITLHKIYNSRLATKLKIHNIHSMIAFHTYNKHTTESFNILKKGIWKD